MSARSTPSSCAIRRTTGVAWTRAPDVGAAGYRLLRSDGPGDAFLAVGARRGPGAGDVLDRGVLPGRTYRYAVVAESGSGCLSPGNGVASLFVGSALRVVTALCM